MGQAEYEGMGKPEVVYGKPSMALVEPWLWWWHGKAYDRSDQQTFESWKLDEIGRKKCEVTSWTLERCLPEWLKIQQAHRIINIQQLSSFICLILVLRRSWAGYTLIWWRWGAVPSQSHRPQMPQLLHQKGCCRCWPDNRKPCSWIAWIRCATQTVCNVQRTFCGRKLFSTFQKFCCNKSPCHPSLEHSKILESSKVNMPMILLL